MKEQCVTPVGSNPYLAYDGSVSSALTMTYVLCVTMEINIISDIGSTEFQLLDVIGEFGVSQNSVVAIFSRFDILHGTE